MAKPIKTEPKIIPGETKTDALAKFGSSALQAHDPNVPEYLREMMGNREGNEAVSQDDILIPRLALAQDGMSPQLKKANEAYIPGLEPGDLFNSVSGEIYGTSVTVVPLIFFKNFIEFVPMKDGGGVRAMYGSLAEIPAGKLQFKDGETPEVTEFKNRLSLLLHDDGRKPELIVVSFKSSGLKAAKKWNSLIQSTNLPAYARSYKLTVVNKVKGTNTYFGLGVDFDVFVPKHFFDQAKDYFDSLSQGGYRVDTSGLEDDGDANETGAGGNTNF